MTKEHRERTEKWAITLESGEFRQVRAKLRDDDGKMCCLGVGCEVFRRETGKGKWIERLSGGWYFMLDDSTGSKGLMPNEVADWYGLCSVNNSVTKVEPRPGTKFHAALTALNDSSRKNFKFIAARIRTGAYHKEG